MWHLHHIPYRNRRPMCRSLTVDCQHGARCHSEYSHHTCEGVPDNIWLISLLILLLVHFLCSRSVALPFFCKTPPSFVKSLNRASSLSGACSYNSHANDSSIVRRYPVFTPRFFAVGVYEHGRFCATHVPQLGRVPSHRSLAVRQASHARLTRWRFGAADTVGSSRLLVVPASPPRFFCGILLGGHGVK